MLMLRELRHRLRSPCVKIMRIGLPAGVQSAVFSVANIIIQVGHQQPRHRCHGRLQRRVQHRNHRLLRAQLVQPGLRHLRRAKLRSRTDRTLQARAWHLHSGGFHRHRRRHRRRAVLSANSLLAVVRQRHRRSLPSATPDSSWCSPAYTFSMLYEVMSGYLRGFGISLVPALLTVIGVVGVRITWIAFVFPAASHVRGHHDRLPDQPRRNRRTHRHRSALLPSVQAICR